MMRGIPTSSEFRLWAFEWGILAEDVDHRLGKEVQKSQKLFSDTAIAHAIRNSSTIRGDVSRLSTGGSLSVVVAKDAPASEQ
jgi:hypothetical protein